MLLENLRIALAALWANKMRSVLTTLGIVIGVAAVIAVVSIVQGLQYLITDQLQGVGATYVIVMPDSGQQGPGVVSRQVRLTWEDGQALQQEVRGIRLITPLIMGNRTVKAGDRQHSPFILGVNADWPEVNNHVVERGRFLSKIDLTHRRKVAVVGTRVVKELELVGDPVGQEIYVGNVPTTIVGVMEELGQVLGQDNDDFVFIPFETSLNLFGRRAGETIQLRLQAKSADVVEEVEEGIKRVLRKRHKIPEGEPNDFRVLVQDEILRSVNGILGFVTAAVSGIVGIALLVGGIGIMNIMLVSVTERTREIGIRKSVGARRSDLLLQFLIEAITLSLLGGAIGVALGYGLGALAANALPGDWPPAQVPFWAIAIAFGFSALVGVFFGIYPASKAARLDPIDALRYE